MPNPNMRHRSVNVHDFAMVPRADVPRSTFDRQSRHLTTFNASLLIPVFVDEVLPGDTFNFNMAIMCRMSTPVFPVMDNLYLESFFFFVPNRLVWDHWEQFNGQQANPGDSIDYTIPQIVIPGNGYDVGGIYDYFGLPTVGQFGAVTGRSHSALPLRAYNLIYNEWFRDENLVDSAAFHTDDGPDLFGEYFLRQRGKRHDYFTGCLPFAQKGNPVTLPLGTTAPVIPVTPLGTTPTFAHGGVTGDTLNSLVGIDQNPYFLGGAGIGAGPVVWDNPGLVADLSTATAATINAIRQAFQIQKLLERDARGGTRYTEIVRSHFGVVSPDARLQRPEYLGGGSSPVQVGAVPQTSATGLTGGTTPQGSLSAFGTVTGNRHGFTYSATEHGHIIGLICVRADLSYQQGMRRMWSRETRYDFYWPVFAMLGEQAVLNQEIYCDGSANDLAVFGYQERWAEYRYFPSQITGLFRSTAAGTLDAWHLAQRFTTLPELNADFISENVPMQRVLAAGDDANNQQFIGDFFYNIRTARAMPMYSVPGFIDHF